MIAAIYMKCEQISNGKTSLRSKVNTKCCIVLLLSGNTELSAAVTSDHIYNYI